MPISKKERGHKASICNVRRLSHMILYMDTTHIINAALSGGGGELIAIR